jgi:hypothetical protein
MPAPAPATTRADVENEAVEAVAANAAVLDATQSGAAARGNSAGPTAALASFTDDADAAMPTT